MTTARIRRGDTVVVISGKDKGKTGRVLSVDAEGERVLVEGVNKMKRHVKPTQTAREGGIMEREFPLPACKVMPVDPATADLEKGLRGTRVKVRVEADGSKTRLAKSGKAIKHEAI